MEEIERSPKTNRRAFDYLASCRQEKKKLGKPQINLQTTDIIKSLKNCKILNWVSRPFSFTMQYRMDVIS